MLYRYVPLCNIYILKHMSCFAHLFKTEVDIKVQFNKYVQVFQQINGSIIDNEGNNNNYDGFNPFVNLGMKYSGTILSM